MTLRNLDCHWFGFALLPDAGGLSASSGESPSSRYPQVFLQVLHDFLRQHGVALESPLQVLQPIPPVTAGRSLYLRAANASAPQPSKHGYRVDWVVRTIANALYLHTYAEHPRASESIALRLRNEVAPESRPSPDDTPEWLGEGYCWTAQCSDWLGRTPARALQTLTALAGYNLGDAVAAGALGCGGQFALFLSESEKQQTLLPIAFVVYPREMPEDLYADISPNHLVFHLVPRFFLSLQKLHRASRRFYTELLPHARATMRAPLDAPLQRKARSLLSAAEQRALDASAALNETKTQLTQLQQLRSLMEQNLQSLERLCALPVFHRALQQRLHLEPLGRFRNAVHDARYWENELAFRIEALRQQENTSVIQWQVVNIRLQRILNYLFALVAGVGIGELAGDEGKVKFTVGAVFALIILGVTYYFVLQAQRTLKQNARSNQSPPAPPEETTRTKEGIYHET